MAPPCPYHYYEMRKLRMYYHAEEASPPPTITIHRKLLLGSGRNKGLSRSILVELAPAGANTGDETGEKAVRNDDDFLASGRRLIVPIIAHGLTDTLDSLIIFSGHYPGM